MKRRAFFGTTLGGLGMMAAPSAASAAAGKRTGIYVLENFFLQQGAQVARMHDYFSNIALPALGRVHQGPKIILEALVAPHMPQMAVIVGHQSLEEMWGTHHKLGADKELSAAFEKWESAPEPAFDQASRTVLEATEYSPEISALSDPPKTPRVFELRVYHSPTWRQLKALHERFAGPEIRIFHRVGIHPILYTSTLIGANLPNLTYLIPFDNLAAREKAWDAFGSDPEWLKVRKESIEQHGQISSVIQISLFKATAYSPIR